MAPPRRDRKDLTQLLFANERAVTRHMSSVHDRLGDSLALVNGAARHIAQMQRTIKSLRARNASLVIRLAHYQDIARDDVAPIPSPPLREGMTSPPNPNTYNPTSPRRTAGESFAAYTTRLVQGNKE